MGRAMFELMFRHDLLDSTDEQTDQPPLRESTGPLFRQLVELVAAHGAAEPTVTAAALWANLHGIAQLWAWRSLPLVLGDDGQLDALVDAALDAHLGPVR